MVNPNEAPEGYVAVAYVAGKSSCEECSFASEDCCCRAAGVSCLSLLRDDNCGVYFIPKKEPKEMSHTEDTQPVPSVIPGRLLCRMCNYRASGRQSARRLRGQCLRGC